MKLISPLLLACLWLAGCQTEPADLLPRESAKYSLENTEKFRLLDPAAQSTITCTGLQERFNAAGRLEVVANLRNRTNQAVRVEARCVFRDAAGMETGDATPWQILALDAEATQAVPYLAANKLARTFTITVRSAN